MSRLTITLPCGEDPEEFADAVCASIGVRPTTEQKEIVAQGRKKLGDKGIFDI